MVDSQYTEKNISWSLPIEMAGRLSEEDFVLLYSGVRRDNTGRYSFLACGLEERIVSSGFDEFAECLSEGEKKFENAWFGYLGYGLKDVLEKLEADEKDWLSMPALQMMRFAHIYRFDHAEETVMLWSKKDAPSVNFVENLRSGEQAKVVKISSNMSGEEYLQKVAYIIEKIKAGDLYQANLTRKFYGEFEKEISPFALFEKLCAVSPAAYSAFIKIGEDYILSSSPESFIKIDGQGNVAAQPIKGTARRGKDAVEDEELREGLAASEKDRAENLMIVDLMRNDLARTCTDVRVDKLFTVTTHATIHHLSSVISSKKRDANTALDVVKAAFPPGSMTGAPKISAMNLCSRLERQERGVYSGAIGYFGGDGSCDLSVVIRTLLIRGKKFEFQVGGGIVADSTPQGELAELINKARGIMLALDVPLSALEAC